MSSGRASAAPESSDGDQWRFRRDIHWQGDGRTNGAGRPRAARRRTARRPARRRPVRAALVAVLLSAGFAPSAFAADPVPGERWCGVPDGDGVGTVRDVARIEFEGNRVTRPEVMLREIPQRSGEPCSLDAVVDGIQGIMDLDLFRSIRAELALERGAGDPPEGALVLRYTVREKIFFLAIPRLSRTSDGELRTGLQLRWDNFSGRLHELRITAERRREDDGRGRSGFVRTLDYSVPRFLGSDWGAGIELALEERQVEFGREGADVRRGTPGRHARAPRRRPLARPH